MRNIIYKCLQLITYFVVNILNLVYWKSSIKSSGVFISSVKINGTLDVILEKGIVFKSSFTSLGDNNRIVFKENVNIRNCSFIIHGNNCFINIFGDRLIQNTSFELYDDNIQIIVNKNSGFNGNRVLVAGDNNYISIGSDCVFAPGAELWASDTHSVMDIFTNERINKDKPIVISDRVWLGNRSTILKGVTIGHDSIIAAGSVVTKNIPENSIAAGVPFKIVRNNIKWDINRL